MSGFDAQNFMISPATVSPGATREDCNAPQVSVGPITINWLASFVMTQAENGQVPEFKINFDTLLGSKYLSSVQTIFVDNSECPFDVAVSDSSGRTIIIPAGFQVYEKIQFSKSQYITVEPAVAAGFLYDLQYSSVMQTSITFFNYFINPKAIPTKKTYGLLFSNNTGNNNVNFIFKGTMYANFFGFLATGDTTKISLTSDIPGISCGYVERISGASVLFGTAGSSINVPVGISQVGVKLVSSSVNNILGTAGYAVGLYSQPFFSSSWTLLTNTNFSYPLPETDCNLFFGKAPNAPNGNNYYIYARPTFANAPLYRDYLSLSFVGKVTVR
jgi:hypothetical protein